MAKRSKKITLVTGAGGYIGSVLVKKLVDERYNVRAIDTFYWGMEPIIQLKKRIEIVRCDIRDIKGEILENVENVIHTAGLSNDPMAEFNPKANFEINTLATANLARLCKKYSVRKFIFASSASIYDRADGGEVLQDETAKVNPKAAYSLSKFKAEKAIIELADRNFIPVIFRQGTVYGYSPRMRYDLVVNTMVKDALAFGQIKVFCKGQQWRPLVDVNDVAKAYLVAIENQNDKGGAQIFNLLYKNYRMLELSKAIKKVLGKKYGIKIKIRVDNSSKLGRNYKICSKKLSKFLNWQPTISPEQSVEHLVKQIRKNFNADFNHPKYYNIEWMKLLTETQDILRIRRNLF